MKIKQLLWSFQVFAMEFWLLLQIVTGAASQGFLAG